MSTTMSFPNMEPPPLFTQQRSPSPQRHPPHHSQIPHTPPPAHMDEPEDIDMTTSIILSAQNHDRRDAPMDDSNELQARAMTAVLVESDNRDHANLTDSSSDSVAADEMDTTPDGSPAPSPAAERAVPSQGDQQVFSSPPIAGQTPLSTAPVDNLTLPALGDISSGVNANGRITPLPGELIGAGGAAVIIQTRRQSISSPESPRVGTSAVDEERIEDDSSDEDDGRQAWHEIVEDKSVPDEQEMKEINASRERNANDHEYWEKKTFAPMNEPEYRPGASGRIHWTVTNFNGTKENPNKELVMFSPTVKIGDYEWQIKFYPKGNDSDYLSVYIECATVAPKTNGNENAEQISQENETEPPDSVIPEVYQSTPLPLIEPKRVAKRRGVAAQCSVLIYNPAEPRVNYHRTNTHRFCAASSDWGWTRFHGPYYEIQHRHRGQRQALLRNDTLAFTGYIRLFEDDTDCLWEHPTKENPWDSLAMTGLQGLNMSCHGNCEGNLVSAISTWMLLKPFRELIYEHGHTACSSGTAVTPKPMMKAFQKILYILRTRPERCGTIAPIAEQLHDAFNYYGIDSNMEKMDVIEVWEVLRAKLEDELQGTALSGRLVDLFGPRRDRVTDFPTYKVPVKGSDSVQRALEQAHNFIDPAHGLPQILQIELNRQDFDETSRTWKKNSAYLKLDDHIRVKSTGYSLFGMIVHKENLQSGLYNSVVRPNGPGTKWFTYKDSKDGNRVVCIPASEAVDGHEGSKERNNPSAAVAYVVVYIRDDIAYNAFDNDSESHWPGLDELALEVRRDRDFKLQDIDMIEQVDGLSPSTEVNGLETGTKEAEDAQVPEPMVYKIFSSNAFLEHDGHGIMDCFSPKWNSSKHVLELTLDASDRATEVRRKIASLFPKVKDPRQCKFWAMSPLRGSHSKPKLTTTGLQDDFEGDSHAEMDFYLLYLSERYPDRQFWVHIVDEEDLPPLLVQPLPPQESNSQVLPRQEAVIATTTVASTAFNTDGVLLPQPVEDTPMGGAENETRHFATESAPVATNAILPPITAFPDTEMGGLMDGVPPPVLGNLLIPSPPRLHLGLNRLPSPPPCAPMPTPLKEVYFFLKKFDADSQTLKSIGSYITKRNVRVDHKVHKILDIPKERYIQIWREERISSARLLRHRKSFSDEGIGNGDILIVQVPLSDTARASITARAAFANPNTYLRAMADARNFPDLVTGHFTLDYFSSEYYSGSMQARQPHGEGKKIYHNGDTYTGSFQLGQRHGDGIMTFQNGNIYKGEWMNGLQHGNGSYLEKETGNMYVGGWKNDKRFGEGITRWKIAQETEPLCRICWENNAEAAFYDCGHVVACLVCARQVDQCPVCRKRVLSAMKLYFVS